MPALYASRKPRFSIVAGDGGRLVGVEVHRRHRDAGGHQRRRDADSQVVRVGRRLGAGLDRHLEAVVIHPGGAVFALAAECREEIQRRLRREAHLLRQIGDVELARDAELHRLAVVPVGAESLGRRIADAAAGVARERLAVIVGGASVSRVTPNSAALAGGAALAAHVVQLLAQDLHDLRLEGILDVVEEVAADVLHDGAGSAVVLRHVAAGVQVVEHRGAVERAPVERAVGAAAGAAAVAVVRRGRRRRRIVARVAVDHQRRRLEVRHHAGEGSVVEVELEPAVRRRREMDVEIGGRIRLRQARQRIVVDDPRLDRGGASADGAVLLDGADIDVAGLEMQHEVRPEDVASAVQDPAHVLEGEVQRRLLRRNALRGVARAAGRVAGQSRVAGY
jgi:hypothetical protein